MKTKRYMKIMAAVLLAGAPMFWSACTDAWDDHYGVYNPSGNASIWQNLSADEDLANFVEVLSAIGCDQTLNSPQRHTIWAPKNMTAEQAATIIDMFNADKEAGLKLEDNKAYIQFYQNQTALYDQSVSSLTDSVITMLNGKYMRLLGTGAKSGSLAEVAFDDAIFCSNGIIYKTDAMQPFDANVREKLEMDGRFGVSRKSGDITYPYQNFVEMITSYDEYELDESASVPGGVVDGKTVYLDSVVYLYNDLLWQYGHIQREDSTYWVIAPTKEVWNQLYDKYAPYYTYDNSVPNRDSLANENTCRNIIQGRFINASQENKYNRAPNDSLVNTQYYIRQSHNPRQDVYYKPFAEGGVLNGLESIDCSNGKIYVDDQGVIDPHATFFGRRDQDATSSRYYEVPKSATGSEDAMVTRRMEYIKYATAEQQAEDEEGNLVFDGEGNPVMETVETDEVLKTYDYLQVTSKVDAEGTKIYYKIPNTLSNVYYNIYIVTTPTNTKKDQLPCWFQVEHAEKQENGAFSKSAIYNNPYPVTSEGMSGDKEVANADVILGCYKPEECYVADAAKVDTILIQKAVKYDYSGYGLDEGVVRLTIGSWESAPGAQRNVLYTSTLRLNEIIFIPFEEEADAIAAADDLDAFNDEILEAKKKKEN